MEVLLEGSEASAEQASDQTTSTASASQQEYTMHSDGAG